MKRIIVAAALSAALALGACAVTPKDPAQAVYQIQGDYVAALSAAVKYKQLPPCGQPSSPPLCSSAAVEKRLQDADDLAYSAINGAQAAVRALPGTKPETMAQVLASAQVAVQAFVAAVSTTGGK